jgi:hypothetical protein
MSMLLEVRERIKKLPELQKQKQNNQKVAQFSLRMEEAFVDLKECLKLRQCVLIVFPYAVLTKTAEAVRQSKKQVALLLEELQGNFDAIGTNETEMNVRSVRERNGHAKDQIKKEWKRCVDERIKDFAPLVEIVRSIPGNEVIVENYGSIQNRATVPPNIVDSAEKLRDDFEQLRVALGQLKLEGPGGQFLNRAVNGRASAKELLDKEVQEFLEANNLWDVLTIRVGR